MSSNPASVKSIVIRTVAARDPWSRKERSRETQVEAVVSNDAGRLLFGDRGTIRIEYVGALAANADRFALPFVADTLVEKGGHAGDFLKAKDAKGKPLGLSLAGKPALAELLESVGEIRRAEADARQALWAEIEAPRRAEDARLLAAMREEEAALAATFPAGAVRVVWHDPNHPAADGWGAGRFQIAGRDLAHGDYALRTQEGRLSGDEGRPRVVEVGYARAVREGASAPFAWERVCYASAEDAARLAAVLDERDAAQAEKEGRVAAEGAARRERVATEPVPQGAVEAYRRFGGSDERAWEAGDEGAWADIRAWADHIEAQGLAREAARESYVNDGD